VSLGSIVNKYLKVNCVKTPELAELFTIKMGDVETGSSQFKVDKVEREGEKLTLTFSISSTKPQVPLARELEFDLTAVPEVGLSYMEEEGNVKRDMKFPRTVIGVHREIGMRPFKRTYDG